MISVLRLIVVAGCLLGLFPAIGYSQLISLNAGFQMTCQFVNNSAYPNSQVYILVLAQNAGGQECYLDSAGNMDVIVAGQNASTYSMTLATIDALTPAGLQFPSTMTSARLWISYVTPLDMLVTGTGGGIQQPNIDNPADPNINTIFDWMEFGVGGGKFFGNTTQVDMFGIPYTMALYDNGGGGTYTLNSTDGINDCFSDIVTEYQTFLTTLSAADDTAFGTLVEPSGNPRIISPIHGSFMAGQANDNYFQSYIDQVWNDYGSAATPLILVAAGNTYSGYDSGIGTDMVFTGPGGPYTVGYPTTQNVFAASGPLATGGTAGAIEAVMDAAFNRHVLDTANLANINNPAAYYQTSPANYYAEFFHEISLGGPPNGPAYGFSYDDENNQSSEQVSNNPRGLIISLSGCAGTPTATTTATATDTATDTSTVTSTDTATNTLTTTSTNTATNTSTDTATTTSTNTSSNTPTTTSTSTSTNTTTDTATTTATNTSSNTSTATGTSTSTNTPTNTSTATAVNTSTNTSTNSPTATSTNSSTNTVVNTPTNTPTNSPSSTATLTRTATATSTATNTPTVTSTPAAKVTMAQQVSETTAQAGDTLTYSIAITVTGNSVNNLVVTDVLPPNMTFSGFVSMPVGTSHSNPSPTQLSWTLPTTLSPGTYLITYQTTVNNFVASGTVMTNTAQLTYTGLSVPLTSSVNVIVAGGPYTIRINVYNSSGEVVKQILDANFSQPVDNITLQSSNTITTLQGPGSTIQIYYGGVLIGTWDGSNNSGNPVSNGNYQIKVDSIGSVGIDTSVSKNVIVNRSLSNVTVSVFNGAGEVVKHLYSVVDDSTNVQMTNVNLSTNVLNPGTAAGSNPLSSVQIDVMTSSAPVTLAWNGVNDEGTIVTPGQYEIQVFWDNGQGMVLNITRSILVTAGGASGTVIARPNVLTAGQGSLTTTFDATGVQNAATINVSLYTVAGELVKTIAGAPGMATVSWDASGVASGIYICPVQVLDSNGDIIGHQTLKVLVMH